MERTNRIVSVLLLVLICCVTVFQCHHHDAAGHAFFLAYGDEEVTLGLQHGDCHNHQDCAVPQDDGRSDCGMHLADAAIGMSEPPTGDTDLLTCVIYDCFSEFPVEEILCAGGWRVAGKTGAVSAGYGHVNLLRGPPCA